MSRRPIEVEASAEDHKELGKILRSGIQQLRLLLRAIALEQLSAGWTAPAVARIVHLSPQAVRRIGHRYQRYLQTVNKIVGSSLLLVPK